MGYHMGGQSFAASTPLLRRSAERKPETESLSFVFFSGVAHSQRPKHHQNPPSRTSSFTSSSLLAFLLKTRGLGGIQPIWVWLKIKQDGLRRCWSMFPLTRATHFGAGSLSHSHFALPICPVDRVDPSRVWGWGLAVQVELLHGSQLPYLKSQLRLLHVGEGTPKTNIYIYIYI